MGGFETWVLAQVEPLLRYHPDYVCGLTSIPVKPGEGQWVLGSLTGAVSSKMVTEECKGWLSADGNRVLECKSTSQLYCESDRTSSHESGL